MPREHNRGSRIADLIQRELSVVIQLEMRDPRVGMVTVNDVKVSRDLSYAEVYVTFLGIKTSIEDALAVLNGATGYLRTQLSSRLETRVTPKLRFHYDETVVGGREMSDLIDAAIDRDHNKH